MAAWPKFIGHVASSLCLPLLINGFQLAVAGMVFVVVQIRARCRVLKPWYGCVVADQGTLIDLYHKYSSGQLDNSEAISSDYATAMVNSALVSSKPELIRVSADVLLLYIYYMRP